MVYNPTATAAFYGDYPVLQFADEAELDSYTEAVDGQRAYTVDEGLEYRWSATLSRWTPGNVKSVYNDAKERWERWQKLRSGDLEWVLEDVAPGRRWEDTFVASNAFLATILGLASSLPWHVNGRRNGANDPNAACLTAANELGGGLSLNVIAAGQDNDYTAISWGDNYPTMLHKSPHFKTTISLQQTTNAAMVAGLVDSTRPAGQGAFGLADNGVFLYYDTDVDALLHCVIRSGAVNVTDATAAMPAAGTHCGAHVQMQDDGEHVRFIFCDYVMGDWIDVSGAAYAALRAAQLQPYYAVVNRAAGQLRQMHVHDFRLIMDRGFS